MSVTKIFRAEPINPKIANQTLDVLDVPAAIFTKKGELKYSNSQWSENYDNGKFENIFANFNSNEAIFRIGKAIRKQNQYSEIIDEIEFVISPFGAKSIVKILHKKPQIILPIEKKEANIAPINLEDAAPIDYDIGKISDVPPISKANLSSLIAGAPIGVARLSKRNIKDAQIIGTNPAFVKISKIDSGQPIKSIVSPKDEGLLDKLKLGATTPVEITMGHDGRTICEAWLLEDGEKASAVLLIDITDRLEMQHRLAHANKMEEIGRLTAEVAHELNNTLNVILLNAQNLLMRHPVGDPDYPQLQEILNTTGRSASLVKSLLAFSRKQVVRREVLDIGDCLSEFSFLLHRAVDERVKLDIHHGRDLPLVLADKQQIETMIINLVTNARDAIISNKNGRGKINVRTRRANKDDVLSTLKYDGLLDVPDIEYCEIAVSDDGSGMPPEVAEQIFKPFFTTKEVGKGTGIGMASVYGIVKQAQGFIALDTQVGVGTSFHVFLPKTDEEIAAPIEKPKDQEKRANNLSGKGRILLVEDETGLRNITAQILKQRGYEITEAEDGEDALAILEDNPNSFDLVISDVIMPNMDGPTMLKEAKQYLGDARVIFVSGYAEQDFSDVLEKDRHISFLPKPYNLVELAEKVKAELMG